MEEEKKQITKPIEKKKPIVPSRHKKHKKGKKMGVVSATDFLTVRTRFKFYGGPCHPWLEPAGHLGAYFQYLPYLVVLSM